MRMTLTRTMLFRALALSAIAALHPAAQASAGSQKPASLAGTWTIRVIPQPVPDVPLDPPPPFSGLISFDARGTVQETDGANHPNAGLVVLPELGPLGMSDGIGAWEPAEPRGARCKILKLLFSADGAHLGYFVTRITLTLAGDDTFDARGKTDIVLGDDPDGEVTFTGPLVLRGKRLAVDFVD